MTGEVEQAQTRLRQFVADVSHELKSPLTSIQGFAQALLDGTAADEETQTRAIQIIQSESKRLKRQVDELLELSRMQSGQARLVKERVDITDVLSRSIEIYSVQAKEKQVKLHLYTEPGLMVTGDADRLEQVFNNLLDNAIKNSPSGTAVNVTSSRGGDMVRVTVADSGPGISAEHLPHVFERFYQVTGVRTGVGLGLTIAREIVLAHGGTIEVSSQPGEGARFTVNLPLAPAT
jgi:two-component system sensor histidine kinase ResE